LTTRVPSLLKTLLQQWIDSFTALLFFWHSHCSTPVDRLSERMPDKSKDEHGGSIEARYANYFEVGHNAVEFVLDLGQDYAELDQPSVFARFVVSPFYAKALLGVLGDAVREYEGRFGEIPEQNEG
jgi:hypothetical protein